MRISKAPNVFPCANVTSPDAMVGAVFTVTVTEELVAVQPFPSVTVTVYEVVLAGEAVGLARVALFKPVLGLQR